MFTTFFDHSYLLQAIGWGILHSLWQSALLWVLYRLITGGIVAATSLVKHSSSLFCLFGSMLWFLLTVVKYYFFLQSGIVLPGEFIVINHSLIKAVNTGLLPVVSLLYILLLVFYTVQFCRQYFSLAGFRKAQLLKPAVDIRLFTSKTARHIGIKKDVQIWLSLQADTPFVTGFFKPVILLPVALFNHLTTAQAEAVILHELAHIRRQDYLINLFQLVAEKVLFFSPFARLLSAAARQERENCCDDWVLNFNYSQHEYAQALFEVERHRNQHFQLAMNATSGKKNLLKRIKRIFTATPVTSSSKGQQLLMGFFAAVIVVMLLLLVPGAKQASLPVTQHGEIYLPFKPGIFGKAIGFTEYANRKEITGSNTLLPVAGRIVAAKQPFKRTADADTVVSETPDTYSNSTVLVNEELLQTPVEAITAIQVSNLTDVPAPQVLMVKVEEEVSGSADKKVYYVELNKNNGVTEMKPLAMVKKIAGKAFKNHVKKVKKEKVTIKKSTTT